MVQELVAHREPRTEDRTADTRTEDRTAELGELYRTLAGQLRQIVRFSIRAPDATIEDACQIAWSNLLRRWGSVRRETALPWLVTTASREALNLLAGSARELPLEELLLPSQRPAGAACVPAAPEEIADFRAKLDQIRALPQRQQRLVWLQGLGFSYTEMAGYTGASTRTVERQLMRAKRALRAAPD